MKFENSCFIDPNSQASSYPDATFALYWDGMFPRLMFNGWACNDDGSKYGYNKAGSLNGWMQVGVGPTPKELILNKTNCTISLVYDEKCATAPLTTPNLWTEMFLPKLEDHLKDINEAIFATQTQVSANTNKLDTL